MEKEQNGLERDQEKERENFPDLLSVRSVMTPTVFK